MSVVVLDVVVVARVARVMDGGERCWRKRMKESEWLMWCTMNCKAEAVDEQNTAPTLATA